jgi:uncharacterized protein YkwD
VAAEEPKPESPGVEEPKAGEPKAGEPKVEEPKSEEPKSQVAETESSTPAASTGDKPADRPSDEPAVANADPSANASATEPGASEGERVTALKPVVTHSVAMTEIHNQYRTQVGLPAQSVDENLSQIAQHWAEHMASVGSMYHGSGEQIIAYSGGDRSYDAGFRTWLGSPPHRAWLCSRGDLCGFGYAIGRNGCAYYAGAFGSTPVIREASSESTNVVSTASYSNGRQARRARRR